MNNIYCIGMWHLGCVTAGCLAKMGNVVYCYDPDTKVIENLKNGQMPIEEKGLKELFKDERINYSTDISDAKNFDIIYLTFDTPIDKDNNPNLTIIWETINNLKPHIEKETLLLISSQLPVGTSEKISKELGCEVCYIPECLRLGNAIELFMKPDKLIFGIANDLISIIVNSIFDKIECPKIFV